MNGLILAGGLATRLGPLAAQLNKSLVTVGQQPMLARQVRQLQRAGCDDVVVVVSPSQQRQVEEVAARAGLAARVTVQPYPVGPVDALRCGVTFLRDHQRPLVMLLADTYLADEDVPTMDNTVTVAPAPAARPWCYVSGDNPLRFTDAFAPAGTPVAVGAYRFVSTWWASTLTRYVPADAGLATFLNAISGLRLVPARSWQDVGDVEALARARRLHFISRSFNELTMDELGVVHKTLKGATAVDELNFARRVKDAQLVSAPWGNLYPRVMDVSASSFWLEHVDLPTLAELWLYWPARPELWEFVLDTLCTRMAEVHWPLANPPAFDHAALLQRRWRGWDHPIKKWNNLRVNGNVAMAGETLVNELAAYLTEATPRLHPALTHGDLNFTNVLWSLGAGWFKLLDGKGTPGQREYDLAKLRYSYHGDFPAVAHGLFDVAGDDHDWTLQILPHRLGEQRLMDDVLSEHGELRDVALLEAALLLNGAPLHDDDEQLALYLRGVEVANEIIA